jgi:UV DNA damage endonuclease
MRLGFPVKVLGVPGMKTTDARRWQSNPSLGVSLEYLNAVFDYLIEHKISMYRMGSDLAPYATHPDLPQFHAQPKMFRKELRATGERAKALGIRLSFHPSQFIVLNSPDVSVRDKSIWDLRVQAELLDRMELDQDAVMVIHVGGSYGDNSSGMDRWCATWDRLSDRIRARLVLENDDIRYSAADVLRIHARTGVRLIFDVQHFQCLNPESLEMRTTVEKFLATWPDGNRPKLHFSSPRTEMREITRTNSKTGKKKTVLQAPIWTGHAAYNHPFEFISFVRAMNGLEFDVMLEAKAKDLALLRLRQDLLRFAPDVGARFGLTASTGEIVPDEIEVAAGELDSL